MELRELISFYHVARLRSVSKAARTLELGQPTVTTHLRKLEGEFGITLFDRIKRPIQLTSEGITLLELVTPVVTSIEVLKRQMDYADRRGSFIVGAYPDLIAHHLPRGIQAFREEYPDIRIRLLARSYDPLIQLVRAGEIDLAFCSPPPLDDPSLEFQELFEYNAVLMTPLGHPLIGRRDLTLEDVVSSPLILPGQESILRQRVDQAMKAQGMVGDVVLSLDNMESIKRYVEVGLGLAVAVDFAVRPEDHDHVGFVRLDHLFPGSVIGICTLKGKFMGQGVRNFTQMMGDYMSGYHSEMWDTASVQDNPQPLSIIDDA